jgi:hypothetical protein
VLLQGGGFCGARTRKLDLNLAAYDGLRLRVKGDGQTFKFNIKTVRSWGVQGAEGRQVACGVCNYKLRMQALAAFWLLVHCSRRFFNACPAHSLTRRTRRRAPTKPPLTPPRMATGRRSTCPGMILCL